MYVAKMENEIKKRHSKDFVKKYHGGDFNDEVEKETPDQRETYVRCCKSIYY